MKCLTASILAVGLVAGIGTASAQSSGYYPQQQYGQAQYGQPVVDRYGQGSGAYYDYARVLRVDPVIDYRRGDYGYPTANGQRCYTTRNDGYADGGYDGYRNDGYRNGSYAGSDGYYRNDGYASNGYSNDGYARSHGTTTGRTVATVVGGVLGAVIGSQVGGGSARYATSAIGSMVGGIAGQRVYENAQRERYPQPVSIQVCDPAPVDGRGYSTGYGVNDSRVSGYDVTYEYGGRTYTTRTSYNPGDRIRVRVDVTPG
jgi:hypothetical protein